MSRKKRLAGIALSLFFLFSLLIAHYFKIQVIEREKWVREALGQHEFIVKEPFKRGTFYSNTSIKKGHPEQPQPFVIDVTKFHLFSDPLSISDVKKKEMAATLASFGFSETELLKELQVKSHSRRLAMWLDRETKLSIQNWWLPYAKKNKLPGNALYFVSDYKRSYPFGKLLGQVLHTIREKKDESTSEGLPTGGLEAYFNTYLKGKQGKRTLLRSPLNQLEIDKVIEVPQDGADIYLTINHCIQAILEEEIEKGVSKARAKGGWAIMMDPYTGEIWGLAQYPFFDPSNYKDFFNNPDRIGDSKVKAVTDAFEMGSIMKPITLAIGLKSNVIRKKEGKELLFTPQEKIDGTRSIFPGRASKPLKERHRWLNMYMALQHSSNVYMAQIIDRVVNTLGNEWYRLQLVDIFGFGEKTGIELPAEARGQVPRPGRLHSNGALEWSLPTPYSLAIGYNLLATSIQMIRAYAVFANGGYLPQPTLVRKILSHDQVLYDHELERKKFPCVLEPEIVREVVQAMKFTTKPGGTGYLADINGYSEAGKTGTAEKLIGGVYSKQKHISSFIGFAPARVEGAHPSCFVLMVSIDEPENLILEDGVKNHMSGKCAAPVFKEIAKRTFEYLGIPPDDPYGYPLGDPRYDAEKADWHKEVVELKKLYEQWNT